MHEKIYAKLKEVAQGRCLITYEELNQDLNLGLDFNKPEDRKRIGGWLDEINRYEHQQNHPMLSAVVVLKNKYIPGEGFFPLARELGRFRGSDKDTFWINELKEVHNHWSSR